MPLLKGNTNIIAIHKGATQIASIYKGTTLVFSSAKWLSYLFEKLYNSLIPTTIQSRNVLDKLKINKVYGNSVVENQLVADNISSSTFWGYTASISNGVVSITKNQSGDYGNLLPLTFSVVANHKYLFICNAPSYANLRINPFTGSGETLLPNQLTTINNNGTQNAMLRINNLTSDTDWVVGTTITFRMIIFDLTQMFPFDTPTTLTDVRVQALLNRGYIPYNTGELKSVDISEFSSEPYNLFDFDNNKLIGFINNNLVLNLKYCFYTPNFISVLPNTSYTFSASSSFQIMRIVEYDKDYNYIKESDGGSGLNKNTYTTTLTANTYFVKLTFANTNNQVDYTQIGIPTANEIEVCFHRTGTRTGYAPHTQPQTLPFIYQGNGAGTSHDTFEITSSEYVFTKNMGSVDLGTLNWTYTNVISPDYYIFRGNLPTNSVYAGLDNLPNILCASYLPGTTRQTCYQTNDKTINIYPAGTVNIQNSSYTSASDFKTAMSGVILQYELSTPQVIRIPKKHLGVVNLGSLGWSYDSDNARFYAPISDLKQVADNVVPNIFCAIYKAIQYQYNTYPENANGTMFVNASGTARIYIRNTNYSNALTFTTAMQGQYLFYETDSEVADIEDMIKIEAGGTLTSDSNVLPDLMANIKCR